MDSLEKIRLDVEAFASERDWDQFHTPKNLAMALSVEASELLEHFQWLTEKESKNLNDETLVEVAHEIADVQVYLVRLADKLGINIAEACAEKMKLNAAKYPVEKSRGQATKYDKLE